MTEQHSNQVSYTYREMELPLETRGRHSVRLYYNHLGPRNREKLPHSHRAVEIDLFAEECVGTYVIGDQTYEIRPGDIFVLRSNEEHSIIHVEGGGGCTCTGIQFTPDFIWAPSSELGDMSYLYEIFLERGGRFHHRFAANAPGTAEIRRNLQDIIEEFNQTPMDYSLMAKLKLIEVLILIAREHQRRFGAAGGPPIQREKRELVEKALNYIDQHLAEPITLEQVAAHIHMSASYLSQLFKQLNGFTVWEYIVSRRIALAKRLLLESDELVLDVSMKCGFNSITNFNRAFKREAAMTPRMYRKKVRA